MLSSLNSESLCIDCGANVGAVAEILSATGATVHCFEPQVEYCDVLRVKFRFQKNVFIHQKAALDRREKLKHGSKMTNNEFGASY